MKKIKIAILVLLIGFLGAWSPKVDDQYSITFSPEAEGLSPCTYEIITSVSGPIAPILVRAEFPKEARYEITIFADEYVDGKLVKTTGGISTTIGSQPSPAGSTTHITFMLNTCDQQNFLSVSNRNEEIKLGGSYCSWINEHLKQYVDPYITIFKVLENPEEVKIGEDIVLGIYVTTTNDQLDILTELQDYLNPESLSTFKQALLIRANISIVENQ